MYDVWYRSVSYTFEFIVVCVCGGGCLSFRMVLCVGCFGGTVLYVCIKYHMFRLTCTSCERSVHWWPYDKCTLLLLHFKMEGFGTLEMHFIIVKCHDVRIRARMRVLCVWQLVMGSSSRFHCQWSIMVHQWLILEHKKCHHVWHELKDVICILFSNKWIHGVIWHDSYIIIY